MQITKKNKTIHVAPRPPFQGVSVSVLVFCYNHESYIRQCLDSIINQNTNFDFEILIHDDFSTDGSRNIISEYALKYPGLVKLYLSDFNKFSQGIKILSFMIGQSKSEFIAYCDGDDFWTDNNKLQIQVDVLKLDNSLVMCNHNAVKYIENNFFYDDQMDWLCRVDSSTVQLRTMSTGFFLLGTIVHRNLLQEFPPEYYLVPNGDNIIPILLSKFGRSKYISNVKPLAYRQHSNGIFSSLPSANQVKLQVQSFLQITSYLVRIDDAASAYNFFSVNLKFWMDKFHQNQTTPSQ